MELLQACCKSPQLLNAVLSCVQHVIAVMDEQGRILLTNGVVKEVFGFTREELIQEELSIFFAPEDLPHLYPNLLYMAKKGRAFEGELTLVRKDGTRFFAYLVFRPFIGRESDGRLTVACIHDIDKQKKRGRAFRGAHYDDLVRIADGIAHELRNPLVIIGGSAKRLHETCENSSGAQKYHHRIVDNVQRLEGLVQKVEFFAHLPKPTMAKQSLRELMQEALQPYLQQMEERPITLKNTMKDTELFVDRNLVVRAFSILLDNALDALPEGGQILLHSGMTENEYNVTVTDDGVGIPSKDLPHIFNPFYRTKPHGVGIDLAVVRQIMDSHDGRVTVTSKQDEGTTFFLTFPVEKRRSIRVSRMEHG